MTGHIARPTPRRTLAKGDPPSSSTALTKRACRAGDQRRRSLASMVMTRGSSAAAGGADAGASAPHAPGSCAAAWCAAASEPGASVLPEELVCSGLPLVLGCGSADAARGQEAVGGCGRSAAHAAAAGALAPLAAGAGAAPAQRERGVAARQARVTGQGGGRSGRPDPASRTVGRSTAARPSPLLVTFRTCGASLLLFSHAWSRCRGHRAGGAGRGRDLEVWDGAERCAPRCRCSWLAAVAVGGGV